MNSSLLNTSSRLGMGLFNKSTIGSDTPLTDVKECIRNKSPFKSPRNSIEKDIIKMINKPQLSEGNSTGASSTEKSPNTCNDK